MYKNHLKINFKNIIKKSTSEDFFFKQKNKTEFF